MTTVELAEYVLNHDMDEVIAKCEEIIENIFDNDDCEIVELAEYVLNHDMDEVIAKCEEVIEYDFNHDDCEDDCEEEE